MNGRAHLNGNGYHNGNGHHPGQSRSARWGDLLKLLYPGIGLKRWLLLGAAGISLCSVGIVFFLRKLFMLTLPDFLPLFFEGVLLVSAGLLVIGVACHGLFRSIGPLILAAPTIQGLANTIYTRRALGKGPRIVAIGGGTGLSVLLRGLKAYTDNLTAIVTVGDDGGSSGRLRRELGVLPPGDFRNCLVAMSEAEPLVTELFQYRFDEGNGLKGHSFGNLFLVALTNVTKSFERALVESSRVLAVHGSIVPSTVANLRLAARLDSGETVRGESSITERGERIARMFIEPEDAQAHPLAIEAIREAQLIVIGPGSLYTSILPNLLVRGIRDAVAASHAVKIYVSNVATEKGETEGYSVSDHLEALQKHTFVKVADYVIANSNPLELGPQFYGTPVKHDGRSLAHARLVEADLADSFHPVRHDSAKLARTIMDVYHRERKVKSHSKSAVRSQ